MQPKANQHNKPNSVSSSTTSDINIHLLGDNYIAKAIDREVLDSEIIVHPIIRQYILLGYAAKGAIYFLIGILAVEAAILPEQKAAGTYAALKHLSGQPLGSILLCLLAITLTGYVWRRLLQAIIYPGHSAKLSPQGLLQRLGYVMSSLSYAGVVYSALNIVFGLGKYNHTIKQIAQNSIEQPFGMSMVFLGGVAVSGVGLSYLYGACTGSYVCDFVISDSNLTNCVKAIGKIGIASRGIAFAVTGICLIRASLSSNADLAGGLQNTLHILEQQPLGWLWLVSIGGGFIAYGIYMFVAAIYRRYTIR